MSRRHGFINYVPQVHNVNERSASENFFGGGSLGKSGKAVYKNIFVHEDSPNQSTESSIVQRYFTDRDIHIGQRPERADQAFNPDFPVKSFSYNYSGNDEIKKIPFNRGNAEDGGDLKVKYHKDKDNLEIAGKNAFMFTPNLSVVTDFNGDVLDAHPASNSITRAQAERSGGGFGSDVRFNPEGVGDIHFVKPVILDDVSRKARHIGDPGTEGVKESYLFKPSPYTDDKPTPTTED
jgi:hypothetical protein